jgi:tetratricopeptide (TPR) repeat protein
MGDPAGRATAYEELARIEADLRGDMAAAIAAWGAAALADPTRMSAVRSLERAYLSAGAEREADLYELYIRLLESLSGARDTAATLLELARLAERTGCPQADVLGLYRRLRHLDPGHRGALFHLEAGARAGGPSHELAELEQSIARAFAGDPRAEAAFHTRAGETLRALGDRDAAVQSFREAVAVLPGHLPALTGWRDAAVAGGRWLDVAEAAERAAEAAESDDRRAELYHLAGVALMDRALDGERAIGVLRRLVDLVPTHTDGFLRLKLLYEETGQDEELVELYHQRLAVEQNSPMRVALHQGLAALYRNFFDDREGARRHLRSALALDPDNLRAVSDLSDIAWELGDWGEAAEALIARARRETRAEVLRHIFYRLGTIYADRLPDPRYAMMSFQKVLTYDPTDTAALAQVADLAARTGDYRLALGACEQLIKLTPDDADKVPHLHRVARIYLDGLQDRQKAERAYRIALDMDPTSETALMALVGFYREAGDSISARVHLDRVAGAMRQRVAADPSQIEPWHVLARALEAREQAGAAGSLAAGRCAAEVALLFGSVDARDAQLAAEAARARPPLGGLAGTDIDDVLFPAPVSGSLRALFRLLGDRIAKQIGVDVRRHGVGRGERLRMGSDPLAGMILEMAGEMGIEEIDVYLSQRQPTVLAVEPTSPLSLVIGTQLASLDRTAELRFLVGRALKLARSSLAVPARMSVDELGALLAGILRQFSPDFTPEGIEPAHIAAEQQKLRRLIPSNMVQELAPFGLEIAGSAFDHRAMWAGIVEGGNRAGLLASGSAAASLGAVLRLGGYRDIHQGVRDPLVIGLLRFAVSEDHAALRAQLGS